MVIPTLVVRGLDELLAGLEAVPTQMAQENERAMKGAALLAEAEIRSLTPRKTGRLFSGWGVSVTGTGFESVGVVSDNVEYGPYVEEDTGPHDIIAHGNALMLPVAPGGGFGGGRLSGAARSGQQVAFYKKVRHPGSRGRHMAAEGLKNAEPGILRIFELAMQRVLSLVK